MGELVGARGWLSQGNAPKTIPQKGTNLLNLAPKNHELFYMR